MQIIVPELAWRLRKWGYLLDPDRHYSCDRLRWIAIRQDAIMKEMTNLDREIAEMAIDMPRTDI